MSVRYHEGVSVACGIAYSSMDLVSEIGPNHRVVGKLRDGGRGFDFALLEFSSSLCGDNDPWADPSYELEVEVIFEGQAYHDGVRHLWFNTQGDDEDDAGYLFWPEMKEIATALMIVRNLEKEHCPHSDPAEGY